MALLSALRRSRAAAVAVLIGTVGFLATAGAFGACGSKAASADASADANTASDTTQPARTPTYTYEVVASYPHDQASFTEGLLIHDGKLFESTGMVGTSWMRELDLNTGRIVRQRDLAKPHFGEGIVILGDKIFQLTYTTGKAFVYDWKTFKPTGEFTYEGEGWSLTTDGTSLIMDDGTAVIKWRDPKTFAVTKSIVVTDHGESVLKINELEWIKGELWANIWQSDQIARIDPATGHVTGWIDMAGLLPSMDKTGKEDVLNGIAYDAATDKIYVTGKYWPKIFEIKVKRRS